MPTCGRRLRTAAALFAPVGSRDRLGLLVNLGLRLSILAFLAEVLRHPDDPRFAAKAIPIRNTIIVISLSLLLPAVQLAWRRWPRFPYWLDSLYLSIFWLDMFGNSADLYDRYYYFDLIPHTHGTGTLAVVVREVTGMAPLSAVGMANVIHILLEAQEYYTDVFFGTRNVRGVSDSINDLLVGVAGTAAYMGAVVAWQQRAGAAGRPASDALGGDAKARAAW